MKANAGAATHKEWWEGWPDRASEEMAQGNPFDAMYLGRDQLHSLPQSFPLIDGVLTEDTYAILRGRDHTFKSFVAMDWACSLATETPWLGRETQPDVRVLYMVGEGVADVESRIAAWEQAHGVKVDDEALTIRRGAIDFSRENSAELEDFFNRVSAGDYKLIVLDTLQRISGAVDENGSSMNLILRRFDQLRMRMDQGTVLVIAHTDKGDNDTRGFSGIEDSADTVWHLKRRGESTTAWLKNTKMKGAAHSTPIWVKGQEVAVGNRRSLAFFETTPGRVEQPDDDTTPSTDKVAETKERICEALAAGDLGRNALYEAVKGNRSDFDQAITEAIESGHITITKRGSSNIHHLARAFTSERDYEHEP